MMTLYRSPVTEVPLFNFIPWHSDQVWRWLAGNMASKVFTSFFYNLTWWPTFWLYILNSSFWPSLKLIWLKMWPLKVFTMVTYFLTWHDPVSNLTKILSRTLFWPRLKLIRLKMWPLVCSQLWPTFWPHVTQFRIWPNFVTTSFLASLKLIGLKMWPLECSQWWPTF